MTYWMSLGCVYPVGQIYQGDCAPGDRAATDAEVAAWQQGQAAAALKVQAQAALDASDRTVLRCVEAGVTVPAAWTAYRVALRAVVSGTSATLPVKPAYPAGPGS